MKYDVTVNLAGHFILEVEAKNNCIAKSDVSDFMHDLCRSHALNVLLMEHLSTYKKKVVECAVSFGDVNAAKVG